MAKKQKLASYLLYLATFGITCSIIALAFGAYRSTGSQVAEQFNKQQLILATEAAAGIENFTGAIENNLFYLGQQLAVNPINYQAIQDYNWELLKDKLLYLMYLDADGKLVDFSPHFLELPINKDYSHTEYYRSLAQRESALPVPYISNVHEGETGHDTIVIATPIYEPNTKLRAGGTFKGVIIAAVDLDKMLELFLSSIKSGHSGYAWLLDNNGNLLYHPRHQEMVGNNIFAAGDNCTDCHVDFRLEREIIAQGKAGTVITKAPNSTEQRLMAYCPIKIGSRFWLVAVEAPYAEVISLLRKSFRETLSLVILAVLTIFFTALYVLKLHKKRISLEEEARELKDLLEATFENAPLEIAVLDEQQKFIYVNYFWERMNATLREDALGHLMCEHDPFHPDQITVCQLIHKTFKEGVAQNNVEVSYVAQEGPYNGKQVHKMFWTIPLFDEQKKIARCAIIGYNMTEEKHLERQLIQSAKLAASGKLAASIAHEVNNPIYGIQGCLDYIRNNIELSEKDRKFVELSYRESERISRLVRKMHDFYHPTEEQMQLTDINELLKDVLLLEQPSLKRSQIKLITSYAPDLPQIMVSADQIKQVFINLINNAKDATPKGGQLAVATQKDNRYLIITFADTGCGISDANKEKIFEAFFTTKKEVKGVGLGLSVSYGIMQRHKGEIEIEDVSPNGAKFIVTLPLKAEDGSVL